MKHRYKLLSALLAVAMGGVMGAAHAQTKKQLPAPPRAQVQAPTSGYKKPIVIMGDDVGWFKFGAYHRGIMSGKTPNCQSARVSPLSVRQAPISAFLTRPSPSPPC